MTEYIERDAISEEIRKYYYKNPPNFSYGEGFDRGLDRAQRAILDAPAADVAEVVHGEWLRSDDDWNSLTTIQCSCCGEEWCFETDDDVSLLNYKYCPNCGARMDGGKDDEAD